MHIYPISNDIMMISYVHDACVDVCVVENHDSRTFWISVVLGPSLICTSKCPKIRGDHSSGCITSPRRFHLDPNGIAAVVIQTSNSSNCYINFQSVYVIFFSQTLC